MQFPANLFIVSSPSGAGKSSLIAALIKQYSSVHPMTVSVSHTTRAMRPGEINGVHYHFVSNEEFEQMIKRDAFFEWARVFDHYYGTSRENIFKFLEKGTDVFLDIDWQGARQIRKLFPEARSVFILPPSLEELERRLRNRAQDSDEVIRGRMKKAVSEMVHYSEYDYVIVNDVFENSLEKLHSIVLAEQQKLSCQEIISSETLKKLLDESAA